MLDKLNIAVTLVVMASAAHSKNWVAVLLSINFIIAMVRIISAK